VYCDHCQTTAVEDAKFCSSCGGKLSAQPAAATDLGSAPTVALAIGPCESCGAPSLPGSTLCLPCTRAFESILGAQPATLVETAPMPAVAEMATLLVPQASALPSAPGVPAAAAPAADDEDEYEDEDGEEDDADDLLGEEAATILTSAPVVPAAPAPVATFEESSAAAPSLDTAPAAEAQADWSTPSTTPDEHEAIVAVLPWARKGPDADSEPAAVPDPEPAAEPTPWWERNGQQSPVAGARPESSRYVPPPSAAPPPSASLESTATRQAIRPKTTSHPPVVPPRSSGSRSRTLVIAAGIAGVAAIGTPVAWKLAFASKPTVVSMPRTAAPPLVTDTADAPASRAPRQERTHGVPPAESPRVYHDLQPEPVAAVTVGKNGVPVVSAAARPGARAPRPAPPANKPAANKPAAARTPAPAPAAAPPPAPVAPAPLAVSATPVATVPAAAAPAPIPAQVSPEAVPLGQIYEVSQVETRPSVSSSFDPVLPARLAGQRQVVLIVRVLVAPSGRAAEATSVKNPTNDAGVAAAAVATVRQWKFTPATRKGKAVSCWYNVGVVFKPAAGN
jgi:TonB family protein